MSAHPSPESSTTRTTPIANLFPRPWLGPDAPTSTTTTTASSPPAQPTTPNNNKKPTSSPAVTDGEKPYTPLHLEDRVLHARAQRRLRRARERRVREFLMRNVDEEEGEQQRQQQQQQQKEEEGKTKGVAFGVKMAVGFFGVVGVWVVLRAFAGMAAGAGVERDAGGEAAFVPVRATLRRTVVEVDAEGWEAEMDGDVAAMVAAAAAATTTAADVGEEFEWDDFMTLGDY